MTTEQLIEKHGTCIEILEKISLCEVLIESQQGSIDGFPGTFPSLRAKYIHKIEIYKMCIARLNERHEKILKQIKP